MLKTRLIPVLLLCNGALVRSERFDTHQIIGNPLHEVARFNEWNVDELIYIDISRTGEVAPRRTDEKLCSSRDPLTLLEEVSRTCFMPLTWGGRIRTLDEIRQRISLGADKVTLNSAAICAPELVTDAARTFGSQAIVVSVDAKKHGTGEYEVFSDCGKIPTGLAVQNWVARAERAGAGEIFLQSIDEDGMGDGYDIDLITIVTSTVSIPVICCSGVGSFDDYAAGVRAGASAVAAANLWHFKELADRAGRRALSKAGVPVRR